MFLSAYHRACVLLITSVLLALPLALGVNGQTANPPGTNTTSTPNTPPSTQPPQLQPAAPLTVDQIVVNGTTYPVTWLSDTTWRITVPLVSGANSLSVTALDKQGILVTNASRTLIVTNTGSPAIPGTTPSST